MAKLAQKKVKKVSAKKKGVAKGRVKAKKPVARAKVAKRVAKARKPAALAKAPKKAAKAKKPAVRATAPKKVAKATKPAVAKAKALAVATKRDAKPVRRLKAGRGPGVRRKDGGTAFLPDPADHGGRRVKDDLAEELGEEFVAAATGEATGDSRDAPATEEEGGPFITTSADSQYAPGTDESNPEDALREPFPLTHGGL